VNLTEEILLVRAECVPQFHSWMADKAFAIIEDESYGIPWRDGKQ
jgi:hypothetical protein